MTGASKPSSMPLDPANVAMSGPHEFVQLGRFRLRKKCRHCFYTEREHPVGWVPSRPYGDKR